MSEVNRKEASEELELIQNVCGDIFSEVQYCNNPPPNAWTIHKLNYIRRELEKVLESLRR